MKVTTKPPCDHSMGVVRYRSTIFYVFVRRCEWESCIHIFNDAAGLTFSRDRRLVHRGHISLRRELVLHRRNADGD